jgi:hypothetical protein
MTRDNFTTAVALGGFAGGTFCTGLALSALHLNPLEVNISSYSEMIASLLGAIVGGGVSLAGTYYFNRSDARRRDEARAYNLLHTASSMYSDMANITGHIERELEANREHLDTGAPVWTAIRPDTTVRQSRQFVPEDLALLFSMKEFGCHGDLVELEMFRNSLCDGWVTFCTLRRELKTVMNVQQIEDGLVSSTVDLSKNPEASLRILEIDSLLHGIIFNSPEFLEAGRKAVSGLGPCFRRYFRDPNFPSIEIKKTSAAKPPA